jgi:uncharacterized OB-fold protein
VTTEYTKPLPTIREHTRAFWEGTKRGELLIQKCNGCGELIFYPEPRCPRCDAADFSWVKSSGRGKVVTFTVVEKGAPPEFWIDQPFVLAIVELDEGVNIGTNVVGLDNPYDVKIGMEVEVEFKDITEEISLPLFRPVTR